jgi:hypothetical protein
MPSCSASGSTVVDVFNGIGPVFIWPARKFAKKLSFAINKLALSNALQNGGRQSSFSSSFSPPRAAEPVAARNLTPQGRSKYENKKSTRAT